MQEPDDPNRTEHLYNKRQNRTGRNKGTGRKTGLQEYHRGTGEGYRQRNARTDRTTKCRTQNANRITAQTGAKHGVREQNSTTTLQHRKEVPAQLYRRLQLSREALEQLTIEVLEAGLLIILILSSVSSVYVRRGSDITDCSMKCTDKESILDLYRECGAGDTKLLELWCDNSWSDNHFGPRLHLNTSSGCWRLTDAWKDDSCEYVLWRHNRSRGFWRSTAITVLDPVLISNITSNSSRLGQDIAVSVQFSGEEAAVTWEVDRGSLPDRYRLMDDNRTLIIPSAQREDAGRRLCVRITNPVSEETREYQLEITDAPSSQILAAAPGIFLFLVIISIFLIIKAGHWSCLQRSWLFLLLLHFFPGGCCCFVEGRLLPSNRLTW